MRIRLVTDPADFQALRPAWKALARDAGEGVFSQHEWFDAAWQWCAESARLNLFLLYSGDQLLAVLPLVMRTSPRGLRHRELSFLAVPDTQACDMIAVRAERATAAVAFADELARRRGEWDVLRLRNLPPGSAANAAFRDRLVQHGFRCRSDSSPGNPYIELDTPWAAYYASRSRRLKKANNLAANRLAKAGQIRIESLAPETGTPGEVEHFVSSAIGISARSWKLQTGNSLDSPGPQAFIRRLSTLAHERGWLSIWLLFLDDRPLAMEYQLIVDGNVYGLRSDFDAACEELSPGAHLNRCLVEALFGRSLVRYYLGPGRNAYKQRWADREEAREDLTVYGSSITGRSLGVWETRLKPWARVARNAIRRPTREAPEPVEP